MKMEIDALIQEETVTVELQSEDKNGALAEMAGLFPEAVLHDKRQFLQDIQSREQEGSTGIGFGFAIPHAKSTGVQKAAIAVGKTRGGMDWASIDGNPVEVIFMIAVPEENAGDDHLKILQQLSRKMMDEEFRQSLKQAETKKQIMEVVAQI
ncbi:PTS sugar transporter subunit IIA [Salibacterium sp. K-3]